MVLLVLLLQIQKLVRENKWEILLGLGISAVVIGGIAYLISGGELLLMFGAEGVKIGKWLEIGKVFVQVAPIAALGITSTK